MRKNKRIKRNKISSVPYNKVADDVLLHLHIKFEKVGKNFYFKSDQLKVPYSSYAKGRAVSKIAREKGCIMKWSNKSSPSVWKTCFKGDD